MFLMLNPSTADEHVNDPTIHRTIIYAQGWGFGEIRICNIFAFRSTDPGGLKTCTDPIGPENDRYILQTAKEVDMVLCSWGNHGPLYGRAQQVVRMLEKNNIRLHCLSITKQTEPEHPLYLKGSLKPQPLIKHNGLLQIDIESYTEAS